MPPLGPPPSIDPYTRRTDAQFIVFYLYGEIHCLTTMSLAQVVTPVRVPTYSKIDDDDPLALFHKKFLGKSMKDEEAEWKEAQTQKAGQPEDKDQDKYEAMEEDQDHGKGKVKATDEGGDKVMNEGEGKPDEDDDILPGCYLLDTGIDDIPLASIWIRADYIHIFDFFQAYYDEYAMVRGPNPSAVLTGQPGIGKSLWIYYAARRLLAEKRPFIWFYVASYYLFVDDGVYELPPHWKPNHFSCTIWTLVDLDQNIPEILVPHGTRLFLIYVTSPVTRRWSRLDKTTQSVVVVMNPWSRREIQRVARLLPREGITETHVNEIFDQLGPIPRLCIDLTSNRLARYRNQLQQAIEDITMDEIRKLTNETSRLAMDAVSHEICLLSRQDRDVVESQVVVAPITDYIKSRLLNQFRNLQRGK